MFEFCLETLPKGWLCLLMFKVGRSVVCFLCEFQCGECTLPYSLPVGRFLDGLQHQNFKYGYRVTVHQLDMKEFVNVNRSRTGGVAGACCIVLPGHE